MSCSPAPGRERVGGASGPLYGTAYLRAAKVTGLAQLDAHGVVALLEGALALALLVAGGSEALSALQAGSLITALPFSVVMILMAIALVKALSYELKTLEHRESVERLERVADYFSGRISSSGYLQEYVDDRIDYRISRTRGLLRRQSSRGSE